MDGLPAWEVDLLSTHLAAEIVSGATPPAHDAPGPDDAVEPDAFAELPPYLQDS